MLPSLVLNVKYMLSKHIQIDFLLRHFNFLFL